MFPAHVVSTYREFVIVLGQLTYPLPCIPNSEYVKPKSYNYQELVISGSVAGQSDEIETEKYYGYDDVCPASYGIVQR